MVVWLLSLFKKWERRQLLENTRDKDRLQSLSWQEFELLVGEYYRRQGYRVEERGGAGPDGGVDIMLRKDGRAIVVQCKHWKNWNVGVKPIRELCGVMQHVGAHGGIFAASGRYSKDAIAYAAANNIELIDGDALVRMINAVQAERRPNAGGSSTRRPQYRDVSNVAVPAAPQSRAPQHANDTGPFVLPPIDTPGKTSPAAPACPLCGSPMTLRTTKKGPQAGAQFYGCTQYPRCRGTRNLPALPRTTP